MEAKTVNSNFYSYLNRDMSNFISEGEELYEMRYINDIKITLSNQELNAILTKPLKEKINNADTADDERLKNAVWNMFYIGLSIGNRIRYDGKFQWEIEEEKEMAEWLSRQNSENHSESE